jgi:hypothetical protein
MWGNHIKKKNITSYHMNKLSYEQKILHFHKGLNNLSSILLHTTNDPQLFYFGCMFSYGFQ